MRLSGTKATAIHQYRGLGNQLWDLAGDRPTLDLDFASKGDLVDGVTGKTLVTHTRASSGTYVNADGLIKTATTNLLLQSEDFSTTWFILQGSQYLTTNQETAPNGTVTADKFTGSGASSAQGLNQNTSSIDTVCTFSVYAKYGTHQWIQLFMNGDGRPWANYDLVNGVVGSATGTDMSASIEPVGDGWYRCSLTRTVDNGSNTGGRIYLVDSGTATRNAFSATSDYIYIWGAQLEQSSTVGEYVKTTSTINSAPRFDHDPETGESLGLLVEESRTNLVLQSQALTTSPWNDSAATTSLASAITDVFGGTSASFKLTEDNTNSAHLVSQGFTLPASTSYSVTAWFKQGSTNRDGRILLTNTAAWDGAVAPRARIEFSTGTVQSDLGFTSTSLVSYSNGWYRFTGTALTSASGGSTALRLMVSDVGEVYQGDGTSFVYVGPCQLEEASSPTSYIPTEGTTVTRAADVASISGANFSSWYRQDEGTVFASSTNRETYPGNNVFPYLAQIDDGTNSNRVSLDFSVLSGGYRYNFVVRDNSVSQFEIGPVNIAQNTAQWAVALKSGDFAASVSVAPTNIYTNTTGVLPAVMTQLAIGRGFGQPFTGTIRRLTFWPKRLPDSTLQTITQ